jgi:mannitol-specific phosphotransferase system IIBC component
MNRIVVAALFISAFVATPAFAQAPKAEEQKELTEQQQRMQQCNADAKKQQFKDGEARQAFMSTCLKGGKPMTQQEKMAACNKEAGAKAMKGDDRKAFMSKCLSG